MPRFYDDWDARRGGRRDFEHRGRPDNDYYDPHFAPFGSVKEGYTRGYDEAKQEQERQDRLRREREEAQAEREEYERHCRARAAQEAEWERQRQEEEERRYYEGQEEPERDG